MPHASSPLCHCWKRSHEKFGSVSGFYIQLGYWFWGFCTRCSFSPFSVSVYVYVSPSPSPPPPPPPPPSSSSSSCTTAHSERSSSASEWCWAVFGFLELSMFELSNCHIVIPNMSRSGLLVLHAVGTSPRQFAQHLGPRCLGLTFSG